MSFRHESALPRAVPAAIARDLAALPGGHWTVTCPSPVSLTTGTLEWDGHLPAGGTAWSTAPGYYEHSFGIHPLPLLSWDFFFAPQPHLRRGVTMQTYRRSREIHFMEAFWNENGEDRYLRFHSPGMKLEWEESEYDPVVGVRLPLTRTVVAEQDGYRLLVTNRIFGQVPLLRPQKLVVRHFFISEQMGTTDWTLVGPDGTTLVEARNVLTGGEYARFRWRSPKT